LGLTAVCHAGTSFTEPQSNVSVPPRFGSRTSTPSPPISFASSTIATTVAPVRLAIATVSPRWSPWPCVSRIVVASSSSALAAALGLPVRNGSTSTVVPPSLSAKAEWPRKRSSISVPFRRSSGDVQRARQLEAHGHADEHAQARLLLDERADRLPAP